MIGKRAKLSKGERTRARIVVVSRAMFEARGYAEVSMREIATACDMPLGSIQFHFATKRALYATVLKVRVLQAVETVTLAIAALDASADPIARLETALHAHVGIVIDSNMIHRMEQLRNTDEALWRDHVVEHKIYSSIFSGLFEKISENGGFQAGINASILRMLILGALNWTPEWLRSDGPETAHGVVTQLMLVLRAGALQPRRSSAPLEPDS